MAKCILRVKPSSSEPNVSTTSWVPHYHLCVTGSQLSSGSCSQCPVLLQMVHNASDRACAAVTLLELIRWRGIKTCAGRQMHYPAIGKASDSASGFWLFCRMVEVACVTDFHRLQPVKSCSCAEQGRI